MALHVGFKRKFSLYLTTTNNYLMTLKAGRTLEPWADCVTREQRYLTCLKCTIISVIFGTKCNSEKIYGTDWEI